MSASPPKDDEKLHAQLRQLRKDTEAITDDPELREQALRELSSFEAELRESDRRIAELKAQAERATRYRYRAPPKGNLVLATVLSLLMGCTVAVLTYDVVFMGEYVTDGRKLITAVGNPIRYWSWVTFLGASTAMFLALGLGCLLALIRYPNAPFGRAPVRSPKSPGQVEN